MRPWNVSIRRQLLCWLLIPIVSLWIVGAVLTYLIAMDFADTAYDSALLDSAHAVISRLVFKGSTPVVDLPPAALAILKYSDKDDLFFQVLTSDGKLISGDDTIPAPDWSKVTKEPHFRDANIGANEVRVASLRVAIPNKPNNDFLVIQLAETLQAREEITNNIIFGVVGPQFILILLAAGAVWFGVARGLKPLRDLQNAVASRSPSDLRPLSVDNAPKEVKPLVNALNDLLDRLNDDREAQKRFVANAAHQLRTPLAGLKTQTELAQRQDDSTELQHSLGQIRLSADRAARLVQQLLTLARVEPGVFKAQPKKSVDLAAVARDATRELVPQALGKEIDLGFEAPRGARFVHGDAKSLYEMAINLIENAILYTQPGGKVTVKLIDREGTKLVIEDNGPGIAEGERERVFERFYRSLGQTVDGSGLGLAIVREIAEAHSATVNLRTSDDGCGTTAEVFFPGTHVFSVQPPVESTSVSQQTL